jgi:hypothetical protein
MGDFNSDFSNDFSIGTSTPTSDLINYVFGFPNAGAAGQDTILGPYRGQEVLIYFPSFSSVKPLAGYQPMVSQYGPIISALYNHPNLLFALDLALSAKGQNPVLKSVFSNKLMAELILILSNYGTLVNGLAAV